MSKTLEKVRYETNENIGKPVEKRSFEEILNNSVLLIDKHKGPTSYSIDKFISKVLNVKRVGHAGTLDPNATGLLPILLGKANKAMDILKGLGKEYVGIAYFHDYFDENKLKNIIASKFIGEIIQIPPVRSAVARVPRKKKIYYFEILEIEGKNVLFKVGCEAGLYVRKLVVDVGKELGVNAHLKELRRTKIGNFHIRNSISIFKFKEIAKNEEELKKFLIPTDFALSFLKKIFVKDSAIRNLVNGSPLYVGGVVKVEEDIKENDIVAIYSLKNELIAIGKSLMNTQKILEENKGIAAKVDKVFMEKGIYL